MQTRSSDENLPSVCLSVRLSHACMYKTVERSVQIYTPYERSFSLFFWEEEWVVGGDPFCVKIWVNRPRWSEIADFKPIIARSSSAVTPSEKSSINANTTSNTHFPMSLRWSSYVANKSPKGVSKTQNGRFRKKLHFAWRKSATKFLCVKTVSGKVVRHSLA